MSMKNVPCIEIKAMLAMINRYVADLQSPVTIIYMYCLLD